MKRSNFTEGKVTSKFWETYVPFHVQKSLAGFNQNQLKSDEMQVLCKTPFLALLFVNCIINKTVTLYNKVH